MSERPASSRPLAEVVGCLSDFDPASVPVAQASAIIERFVTPIDDIEQVAIRDALGRVLARDVLSPIDVPAHDNSAMDGYAVHGASLLADTPTRLAVVGRSFAGRPFAGITRPGEAVRVMTGAVMPAGLDTVVIQEIVTVEGDSIVVPPGQQAGQHRRRRGEDLVVGGTAIAAGRVLTPADLGLVASLGIAAIPVQRRLRVAFFSTGDELRSVGEALAEGEIYDSNRYALHGMLTRLGVEPIDLGVVRDDPIALEEAMTRAATMADAIISSGGVSVGEADFTRSVMDKLGEVAFWSIAMRPGRPLAFGRIGDAIYFGLPGNPVAVMITFYFFARAALCRLMGALPTPLFPVRALVDAPLRKRPGRTEYQRGVLGRGEDGVVRVRVTGPQGSGMLRSMSQANCIVVLHHEQGPIAAGDPVDCVPFDGLV